MVFCHSFVLSFVLITFEFYSLKEWIEGFAPLYFCTIFLPICPFVLCFRLLSEFCILVYGVAILFFSFSILSFFDFLADWLDFLSSSLFSVKRSFSLFLFQTLIEHVQVWLLA